MKKFIFLLVLLPFLSDLYAQEPKESKLSLIFYGGIGYGIVENDNEPNYNLNSNSGDFLVNYKLGDYFGLASGIGFYDLSGNGFNSQGDFYHERRHLKIPFLATIDFPVSEKLKLIANFGLYTQTIIKDQYRYLDTVQEDVFDGWNFGGQLGIGFLFRVTETFYAGANFNGQSDFSKFETAPGQDLEDKQRLDNLSHFGVIFQFKFR